MMLKYTIATMAYFAVVFAALDDNRPCGFKIAPCPKDTTCVPNEDDCTDLDVCPGTCRFKNEYPSCGGFRIEPQFCDQDSTCKDDPRVTSGCGMACDAPGICVPNDAPSCGKNGKCPKGLYCYPVARFSPRTGTMVPGKQKICL